MVPFETLYGRRCRTPLNWFELSERVRFSPDLSWEKSYSDKRRRPLVFEKGEHVYLCVSPMKRVHWFRVKGKLVPWYIGSFKITKKCGPYLTKSKEQHKEEQQTFTKCNGVSSPKKRQLENKKNTCILNIL
ncbi:hypothetical protein U9M48_036226, partial [Paspalum notatum var. saurae]